MCNEESIYIYEYMLIFSPKSWVYLSIQGHTACAAPVGAALAPAPPTVLQDALLHEALLRKILGELEPLFFVGEAKKRKEM